MTRMLRTFVTASALIIAGLIPASAFAQKSGGVLKVQHQDSPASMSIIEEATYSTVVPMMGVFNNLVMYKQDEPQNSMKSIVPDLATSWSWSEDGTELTFKLRQGVKWHDGKPFTPADVRCTYDLLLGKAKEKLRINPRKVWFRNLEQVTADSDGEADLSFSSAATSVHHAARLGLLADLPLPCVAARDAHPPDRHRAL